jgi:hypothetical protein
MSKNRVAANEIAARLCVLGADPAITNAKEVVKWVGWIALGKPVMFLKCGGGCAAKGRA